MLKANACPSSSSEAEESSLGDRLRETRQLSEDLAAPLTYEDMTAQAMDDASPTKWHLAHTSWFFETFVLSEHNEDYAIFDDTFSYCFNSYYESFGARQARARRGLLTRPSCARVMDYRRHVDAGLERLIARGLDPASDLARLIELGVNHEQQHQELLLTDILALFAASPLRPAYREPRHNPSSHDLRTLGWIDFPGAVFQAGHGGGAFAWDNESPRHEVLIHPFALADRLVTNAEWLSFMADRSYETPTLWLSDGWTTLNREAWRAPLYWEQRDGRWLSMTFEGLQPLDPDAPVSHVSYYEADAFARWAGARLPTEFEWEIAAADVSVEGNTLATRELRPLPATTFGPALRQMFGDVWEWTGSAYMPYPGYRPQAGALGEYNGKFMVNQLVLRGGSCVTPAGHLRRTYRNFFYPHQRWQFMGLRLAKEIC